MLADESDEEITCLIEWTEKADKKFQIKNVDEVAKLWGAMKEHPELNKEGLLRSLRYYYKTNVIRKVDMT